MECARIETRLPQLSAAGSGANPDPPPRSGRRPGLRHSAGRTDGVPPKRKAEPNELVPRTHPQPPVPSGPTRHGARGGDPRPWRHGLLGGRGGRRVASGRERELRVYDVERPADTTFNQLLGINHPASSPGIRVRYGWTSQQGIPLPNDGPASYMNENFPGAAQTQVTGLNDTGSRSGSRSTRRVTTPGSTHPGGRHFHIADYPTSDVASPAMDQLLGVNDHGIAVGFFNDPRATPTATPTHRHPPYGTVAVAGASSATPPRSTTGATSPASTRTRRARRGIPAARQRPRCSPQRPRREHDPGVRGQRR